MIVSKVGNITKFKLSINVTISDINLETGSVPIYANMFKIATCSKTGLTCRKGLNLSITAKWFEIFARLIMGCSRSVQYLYWSALSTSSNDYISSTVRKKAGQYKRFNVPCTDC